MERALSRLTLERGSPRDLGALRNGLSVAGALRAQLQAADPHVQNLVDALADLGDHSELISQLSRALDDDLPPISRDGGFVRAGMPLNLTNCASCATTVANTLPIFRRAIRKKLAFHR